MASFSNFFNFSIFYFFLIFPWLFVFPEGQARQDCARLGVGPGWADWARLSWAEQGSLAAGWTGWCSRKLQNLYGEEAWPGKATLLRLAFEIGLVKHFPSE